MTVIDGQPGGAEVKAPVRINKYLSETGFCSRRAADAMVAAGLVRIGGRIARAGDKVREGEEVLVGGVPAMRRDPRVYLAYHKPAGITCTTDRSIKSNIIDAVGFPGRIFPVGRLDRDSTGLIFLTNDGDIVNRILRAGNGHEKEYMVTVDRPYDTSFIDSMASGIPILGTVTRPCRVIPESPKTFRIILTQGLNRQIRRMCEYLGYDVARLHRVRIMNVHIGTLKPGCWRVLTPKEMEEIHRRTRHSAAGPEPEPEARAQARSETEPEDFYDE